MSSLAAVASVFRAFPSCIIHIKSDHTPTTKLVWLYILNSCYRQDNLGYDLFVLFSAQKMAPPCLCLRFICSPLLLACSNHWELKVKKAYFSNKDDLLGILLHHHFHLNKILCIGSSFVAHHIDLRMSKTKMTKTSYNTQENKMCLRLSTQLNSPDMHTELHFGTAEISSL